jgi:hypothetical protein
MGGRGRDDLRPVLYRRRGTGYPLLRQRLNSDKYSGHYKYFYDDKDTDRDLYADPERECECDSLGVSFKYIYKNTDSLHDAFIHLYRNAVRNRDKHRHADRQPDKYDIAHAHTDGVFHKLAQPHCLCFAHLYRNTYRDAGQYVHPDPYVYYYSDRHFNLHGNAYFHAYGNSKRDRLFHVYGYNDRYSFSDNNSFSDRHPAYKYFYPCNNMDLYGHGNVHCHSDKDHDLNPDQYAFINADGHGYRLVNGYGDPRRYINGNIYRYRYVHGNDDADIQCFYDRYDFTHNNFNLYRDAADRDFYRNGYIYRHASADADRYSAKCDSL